MADDNKTDASVPGVIKIDSGVAGPRVVIFGGTHGDETGGTLAVRRLAEDFKAVTYRLTQGSLTLVEANQEGIASTRWYMHRDLNELFKDPPEEGGSYEHRRVEELKPLLKEADFFLDLHSTPIGKDAFAVVEKQHLALLTCLGIPKLVTGWSTMTGGNSDGDAENYANKHGAISATVEASEAKEPEIGYHAVLALLSHLKMIEPSVPEKQITPEIFELYLVVIKKEDFAYVGSPDNFKFIPQGETYAFQGGGTLVAPEDSYLLMPHIPEDTGVGEKICYLARKLS